jgi:hypothetical protein
MDEPWPPFTHDSVRRVLEFLPAFERGEFREALDVYKRTGRNPANVDAFHSELFDSGFLVLFGGAEWHGRSAVPAAETADLLTLRKLLAYFLQGEKFCGGYLSSRCADGSIESILRRLQHLHDGGG